MPRLRWFAVAFRQSRSSGKARQFRFSLAWAATLLFASLALFLANSVSAEVKPEDMPPAPGALQRQLDSGLPGPPSNASLPQTGGSSALAAPIEIPFIFEGGHIIIEASVGGAPPRPFIFDTGGRNLISPELAQIIKAPVVRTAQAAGIGSKVLRVDMVNAGRITIGAAVLEQQTVGVVDMPNVILDRGSRPRLAGLIGSELLARYTVTVDYGRRVLILNSPGFKPQLAKFSLPLGLAISPDGLSHPSISAELDGVTGDFVLDTGAGGQVIVSERFQQDHKPFANASTVLHFVAPGGIGGHASEQMGFGKQLRIGPFVLSPTLIVGIDPGSSKLGALGRSAGVIGSAVLSRFVITFDVAGARVYFQQLSERPTPTVLFGTGLILDKPDHETLEVLDVIKGSAAANAGLRRGDRVVSVGGRRARDLALGDVETFASNSRAALQIATGERGRVDLAFTRLLP